MPFLRLHDRLVIRLWVQVFVYCVAGFVALFVLADLIEKIDNFIDHRASVAAVAHLYFFKIPEIVRLTLPVDVLLATLFTLGVLGRNNEIVALLASGVSMMRIARPIVVLASGCVLLSAVLAEKLVPDANARVARIKRVDIDRQPPADTPVRTNFHYRGANGYYYYIQILDTRNQRMNGIVVHQARDGRVVQRLDAETAEWVRDHWEFRNGFLRTFSGAGTPAPGADPAASLRPVAGEKTEPFHGMRLPDLLETPEELARLEPDPDAMNYPALRRYVERVRASGGNADDYVVNMYTKVSYPWTSLVLALLGIGVSSRKKKASLASGFGLTLVICFSYLGLTQISAALGKNERLPALVAAWIGNVLFGIAAAILMSRVNR